MNDLTFPQPLNPKAALFRWVPLLLGAVLAVSLVQAASLKDMAQAQRRLLAEKVLPYWFETAQDHTYSGYLLADNVKGRGIATEKQLVSQTRMIWGFSIAHRKGFSTPDRSYLEAATQGYRFLMAHFKDPRHGGYFWKTAPDGRPTDRRKFLYGESFVVYALVEYHRASGDPTALHEALDLFLAIQGHCHDSANGGWIEHCEEDWTPIPGDAENNRYLEVEVAGLKSANAHLHWMEALAELLDVTGDRTVRSALKEALNINREVFYPARPGQSCFHALPNLKPITTGSHAGLSYGHNVEFAWLMIRAQEVLGQPRAWKHFDAVLDHALAYGWDVRNGGLYNRGADDQPATDTQKVWWVQSEMVAALTDSLQRGPRPAHTAALYHEMDFIERYLTQPSDGIWIESTEADGTPRSTAKAHNWKANYHDVRALLKFIDAFDPQPASAPKK